MDKRPLKDKLAECLGYTKIYSAMMVLRDGARANLAKVTHQEGTGLWDQERFSWNDVERTSIDLDVQTEGTPRTRNYRAKLARERAAQEQLGHEGRG